MSQVAAVEHKAQLHAEFGAILFQMLSWIVSYFTLVTLYSVDEEVTVLVSSALVCVVTLLFAVQKVTAEWLTLL